VSHIARSVTERKQLEEQPAHSEAGEPRGASGRHRSRFQQSPW
jgi:hypothetical protein